MADPENNGKPGGRASPARGLLGRAGALCYHRAVKKLLAELRELHARIHENDPPPASRSHREQQAAALISGLQQRLIALMGDGVPPPMVETSVLYHWLRFTLLGLGHDEARIEAVMSDMGAVAGRLARRIEEIAATVDDTGPTRDMQELGSRLEALKELFLAMRKPELSRAKVEQRAMQTTLALAGFIQDHLDRQTEPGLLANALLYHWIRLSTINGNVDEAFFQKIERNWPDVVDGLRPLVESLIDG